MTFASISFTIMCSLNISVSPHVGYCSNHLPSFGWARSSGYARNPPSFYYGFSFKNILGDRDLPLLGSHFSLKLEVAVIRQA